MDSYIRVSQENATLLIQINRPEKKNALTQGMYQMLSQALEQLNNEPSIVAGLIYGAQGCFTSGNDLGDFINCQSADDLKDVTDFLIHLANVSKPLLAAIEGPAIGIGTTMLAHCDLVYSAPDALFQTPFVPLGISPEGGSSLLFPQFMGHQQAAQCLLLGERFSAQKAKELGLVTEIVNEQTAFDFCLQQAKKLEHMPRKALITAKQLLRNHNQDKLIATIEHENRALLELLQSQETQDIMSSMYTKIKS